MFDEELNHEANVYEHVAETLSFIFNASYCS